MRRIFVLIPSPHPTGPIKGAYALANALVEERPVTLVALKEGPGASAALDSRVSEQSLAHVRGGWRGRMKAYRNLLSAAGGRHEVASISMCLSADMVNCLSGAEAVTCASVRGNLMKNYRLDYGLAGVPAAIGHLMALRRADHIVAITQAMAAQVAFYARKRPSIIGNFVDEAALNHYRCSTPREGPLRYVFVATLSERKQPLLAVRAIGELITRGVDATLEIIGSGPLTSVVGAEIARLGLQKAVVLRGQLSDPYRAIASADAMVLPSLSEGIARSALEALHLGVPCIMRDVDGNAELIRGDRQGALFHVDDRLSDAMLTIAQHARARVGPRESLLPVAFRQRTQARRYLDLVEQP
jgi:glycosyltransferase involved in cell wall biosynthesis